TIPACNANYLPEGISEHCPIKVTFVEEGLNTNKLFQFCNVWAKHPLFIDKVQAAWVKLLMVLLKKELKVLNTQFFRNVVAEANDDRMALYLAQNKLQADPMNMTLQRRREGEILEVQKYIIYGRDVLTT
ncbi:hypothetical protein H5410_039682, partial [Solanum commersonii]